jgi:predicted P-loop ATPase
VAQSPQASGRGIPGTGPSWWPLISCNGVGFAKATDRNGRIALANDPAFTGAIRFDRFRGQTMVGAPLPWDMNAVVPRPWEDNDDYEAIQWLQEWGINLSQNRLHAIVEGLARQNPYHPVMNLFQSLQWDRKPRADTWLSYYLGVEDSPYARAVGARWLISAVARIFEPGCKADCVLILEGKTGIGKSSVFKILGGAWYSNDIAAFNTKDAKEQLTGVWIMELDELDAVRRTSEWTAVLSFVSLCTDRYRYSYGRRVLPYPRQCVFGGTTENDAWVASLAGKRRWWPVRCTSIDLDALTHDRDQLLAEAIVRYQADERWWLHEDVLINAATLEQDARLEIHPWDDKVIEYANGRPFVTTHEILQHAIGMPTDRWSDFHTKIIGSILRRNGWERTFVRATDASGKSRSIRAFVRPDDR